MKLSKGEFIKLFNAIDNSFVGSETANLAYQAKYTNYFHPNGLVVDVGCGSGTFLKCLRSGGIEALGLDTNPACIQLCKNEGLNVLHSEAIPFLDKYTEKIDGIYMAHVIEHYNAADCLELLISCHEALKKGGVLVAITPNFAVDHVHQTNFWLSSTHVRPYPMEWLINTFQIIGFDIAKSGYDPDTTLHDTFIVSVKK